MSKEKTVTTIIDLLRKVNAFKHATNASLKKLSAVCEEVKLDQGQTILRSSSVESHAFLVLEGSLRLLANEPFTRELFTVGKALPGDLIGIVDLLRQQSCEAAIARQPATLLSFPLETILVLIQEDPDLLKGLESIDSPCEGAFILSKIINKLNPPPEDPKNWILSYLKGKNANNDIEKEQGKTCYLLSTAINGKENLIGKQITVQEKEELESLSKLPIRFWIWNKELAGDKQLEKNAQEDIAVKTETTVDKKDTYSWHQGESLNFEKLGLKEAKEDFDLQGFKPIRGHGPLNANLATMRMAAKAYGTPCPIDVIERIIEGCVERTGNVPIYAIGQLAETMGLQTQVGEVKYDLLYKLEFPVIINLTTHFGLIAEVNNEEITIADPEKGWTKLSLEEGKELLGKIVQVVTLKKLSDTPQKEFGWNWFTPVIKRFKWSLVQVLLASLFIQLFQLANPLLLQQIIDKVISQSNLSALQVLGGAMVAAAVLQGLLSAVRTWLLTDTTDRMDLVLGTQVIDRLLRLPLRFFEARPVGELSQRLGELGNLRGFLTGTAITSALDLLFAFIYIFIMVMYSPLLTAVALGTVPIYILIIIFIAPVYRRLIRQQAQYAAKTQSHLIETLAGIQTVKAQHIELNSRWKWQERYSNQISEAFKSIVLGSSAGEIGQFLNTLSSLLIIWVGVFQVVNAQMSIGQLIAFRIIAGYVTGPILRLSGLWQAFQQVGISMERLSDIVDQRPEAGNYEAEQISLPPITGKVNFDRVKFRFRKEGDYQIDNVNLEIPAGKFIGIVGQSGSGKSTLMKLLPKLYNPQEGRILIDDYDISKVKLSSIRQQIGIVPQDCLLFEGTVRENIAMNMPEADTETVIDVARAAVAHDFIMELPDGYGTRLGERGAGLSGGQRQRIAIARTILQNPNLLVLDEATSALDYDTEASVCRNLQQKLEGKTCFFITHRLSTIKRADLIILMHKGKIDEMGTHEELMKMGGRYSALYSHQGDE